jgi:hypothetical protein
MGVTLVSHIKGETSREGVRVYKNRVLRNIFGAMGEAVTGD